MIARIDHTALVLTPGASRNRLAGILGAAFAGGLLSEETLTHRLGVLFGQRLVDPGGVVGDLTIRTRGALARQQSFAAAAVTMYRRMIATRRDAPISPLVLALDWSNGEDDLVIGRALGCDVELDEDSVSRRHARLFFRDGTWIIQDLGSTNGTVVNGKHVGRCQLQPGDRLQLGDLLLDID